ncbi:siderophore ferric iron reductase [Oxalicibacterium solurbis]|nr:siderophore ferric iron reductase [Oxalicibacterium solurbis]
MHDARAGSHLGCGATCEMAVRGLPSADADLAQVLRLVQDVVPDFRGELCDAPSMSDENEALRVATALTRYWRHAHPEAGAHYAALRCWGLAIWQPVYLAVIAAHAAPAVPHLSGLMQPVVAGVPKGFRLPAHAPLTGDLQLRMRTAAQEIRIYCDRMRAVLLPKVGLHRMAADRLQAECVLGALLLVGRHDMTLRAEELIAHGQAWLAMLDLVGSCDFFAYRARDGTGRLALDRQVCCHHFRRHDGEKCSTCPKLPLDTRIGLLQAQPA